LALKSPGRSGWVAPLCPTTEEFIVSESTPDRPDEQPPKPGEPDTETEAGFPKEAPDSKDDTQSNEDD